MQFVEGLYVYEVVLLVLGVLLFVAMLLRVVFKTPEKSQWKWIAVLFLFSVVMIGFPGIQEVTFDKGMIEIETWSRILDQNPADSTTRRQLTQAVKDIENRPIASADNLTKVAVANAVIGDTLKALSYVDEAIKAQPNLERALASFGSRLYAGVNYHGDHRNVAEWETIRQEWHASIRKEAESTYAYLELCSQLAPTTRGLALQ
jgi:hypothetical protein